MVVTILSFFIALLLLITAEFPELLNNGDHVTTQSVLAIMFFSFLMTYVKHSYSVKWYCCGYYRPLFTMKLEVGHYICLSGYCNCLLITFS